MTDRVQLAIAHQVHHRPATRHGHAAWTSGQYLIGALTSMERNMKGTIWESEFHEFAVLARQCIEAMNESIIALELEM